MTREEQAREFRKNIAAALSATDKRCALFVAEYQKIQDRLKPRIPKKKTNPGGTTL